MSNLITVTGAAGFIGSHLCDRLIEDGHQVLAIDDVSTGSMRNIEHLVGHPRMDFEQHDITEPLRGNALSMAMESQWIFNLACPASPAYFQREPVKTLQASVFGVWRMLELAQAGGARLLQASTSEVYGDPQAHPQTETYWGHVNPIGLRSCYDEGKRCAEAMCVAYQRQRKVQVRMARIFNTYGPRLQPGDGRVVSNFITQALRGEPLTVYGDGQQTRSFCYVSDTVDGLLRVMNAGGDGPFNIGNPTEHTVLELAETVLRLTGSSSPLERRALPPDDPQRRRPDIARARRQLGWVPRVGLEDGLKATIRHLRLELDRPLQRAFGGRSSAVVG